MDYEKKYKRALGWIQSVYPTMTGADKEDAEHFFPELAESEDERIRKSLIEHLQCDVDDMAKSDCAFDFEAEIEELSKYIAWLEKQGEKPKKVSIWKHWKDGIAGGAADEQVFLIKIGRLYSISSCLGCECDYIELSELDKLMRDEKQGKSKWSEEDEQYLLVCKNALRKYQVSDKWDADIISKWLEDKLKQGEQKSKWSEEDEKRLQSCISSLQGKGLMGGVDTINTKWLKSIKQRMEDEQ